MHSQTHHLPGSKVGHEKQLQVHHNGDYSGDVTITVKREHEAVVYKPSVNDGTYEITIPFYVLEQVVLEKIRQEAIGAFERASYEDLKRKMLW